MNDNTYKWKPQEKLTIDFLFKRLKEEDVKIYTTKTNGLTKNNYERAFFFNGKK